MCMWKPFILHSDRASGYHHDNILITKGCIGRRIGIPQRIRVTTWNQTHINYTKCVKCERVGVRGLECLMVLQVFSTACRHADDPPWFSAYHRDDVPVFSGFRPGFLVQKPVPFVQLNAAPFFRSQAPCAQPSYPFLSNRSQRTCSCSALSRRFGGPYHRSIS